jgi:hypothetical protein
VRIILESTAKVVELVDGNNGHVHARVWEGHTDDGVAVVAFLARIAPADDGQDLAEFERDLLTVRPPQAALAIPHRLLL